MLYTFYGDDFTGSTDVLEQLGLAGIPAVLFFAPPEEPLLRQFPGVQAVGIAGDARSRPPQWMDEHLPPIFRALASLGAPIVHYKTCSTFDSSPAVGSIGHAIVLGRRELASTFVPIVVGAPHLRRFVAFGNLFAADPSGAVQRIDRHPMSRHPVTPMHEADLRLHLAAQGLAGVALLDRPTLHAGSPAAALQSALATVPPAILFDTLDSTDLRIVGDLLRSHATTAPGRPLFAAGSSGLTAALVAALQSEHQPDNTARGLRRPPVPIPLSPAEPLLVLSGSCSPATELQIRHALAHGWQGIALDPAALLGAEPTRSRVLAQTVAQTVASLAAGRSTVLYTSLGTPPAQPHGDALGAVLGQLLRDLLLRAPVRRAILCGGDTSSHAVQQLGLDALTWIASLEPGAPLCRAHFDRRQHPYAEGLELVLKGGQVGSAAFFDHARGSASS